MTQRNVELQLQALDVIERRHFNSTASSSLDDPDVDNSMPDSVKKQQSEEDTELDAVFQEEMTYNYLLFFINIISHISYERALIIRIESRLLMNSRANPMKPIQKLQLAKIMPNSKLQVKCNV